MAELWRTVGLVSPAATVLLRGRDGAQDELFSAGGAYERFMGRWSLDLAALLVRFAAVRDGDVVLDVGSGTGALGVAIGRAAPSSRIVAIDPSSAYVSCARAHHQRDLVQFEVGDAQQLRFENAMFDRTLSLLVMNFIPDAPRALDEMVRVTRPGGTVAAAVWDYGAGMQMLRVFWDEAVKLNPDAEPRDERHMPLCRNGELTRLWRQHGLQEIAEDALTITMRFSSFDDYWLPFLEKQGPAGTYVAGLGASQREKLRDRLRQRLVGGRAAGSIGLTARAWAVRGRVP